MVECGEEGFMKSSVALAICQLITATASADLTIESRMLHLRIGGDPEWAEFSEQPDGVSLGTQLSGRQRPLQ